MACSNSSHYIPSDNIICINQIYSPASATGLLDMKNKELNHGRLAMLAVAGMVAQELVDGKTIWGHFTQGFDYNVRDVFH